MKQKLVSIIIISPKESPTDIIIDQLTGLLDEFVGDPILSNSDRGITKTLSWQKEFSVNYNFSGLQHSFNALVKDSEIMFIDLKVQNNMGRNVSIILNIIGVLGTMFALITGILKT